MESYKKQYKEQYKKGYKGSDSIDDNDTPVPPLPVEAGSLFDSEGFALFDGEGYELDTID